MIVASQIQNFQIRDFETRRLPPARSFAEATAMVDAALGQLRNAEAALERQLTSLRAYMDTNRASAAAPIALPQ